MKKLWLLTLLVTGIAAFGAPAVVLAAPAAKVTICHLPPGDLDNFHTITIGENALAAHLQHGDLLGSCDENLDELCDDGNACTQDHQDGACLSVPQPVNCDDSNACTTDVCDPANGTCTSTPKVCGDGNACTTDFCNPTDGECGYQPVECGELSSCDPGIGCEYPCDGVTCDPVGCFAGECTVDQDGNPACVSGAPLEPGAACDDSNPATVNDVCDGDGFCSGVVCDDTCAPGCDGFACDGGLGTCDAEGFCNPKPGPYTCDQFECQVPGSDPSACDQLSCLGGTGTCDAAGFCNPNPGPDTCDQFECQVPGSDPQACGGFSCDGGFGTCDAGGDCNLNPSDEVCDVNNCNLGSGPEACDDYACGEGGICAFGECVIPNQCIEVDFGESCGNCDPGVDCAQGLSYCNNFGVCDVGD